MEKIKPIKQLGQNFLKDEFILRRIAGSANIKSNELVLEIGTGTGNLTKYLCEKAKFVYTVEKDKRLCKIAEENLRKYNNIKVICDDILKFDISHVIARSPAEGGTTKQSPWREEIASAPSGPRNDDFLVPCLKIIGNLPYYITTPIIFRLLEQRQYISDIFIMVQREVAERIVALPGGKDYGMLSCSVQFYARPKILFNISKSAFSPQPKVDSSLINIKLLNTPSVCVKNEEYFFKFIKAAFSHRRKTLLNSLTGKNGLGLPKKAVEAVLEKSCIDPKRRAETLSLSDFAKAVNFLL